MGSFPQLHRQMNVNLYTIFTSREPQGHRKVFGRSGETGPHHIFGRLVNPIPTRGADSTMACPQQDF